MTYYSDFSRIKTASQKKEEARKLAVTADIKKIDDVLQQNNEKGLLEIHRYIDGKYQACITGWNQSVYGYVPGYGFNYDVLDSDSLIHNLKMMKPKLEAFADEWNVAATPSNTPTIPEINVNTTTNVNVSITFEQVREKIEDMTALSREQTDEILEKINELEEISKEKYSRKTKWEKVKPIIAFALDKGADVAIAILSLVMQMKLGV